MPKGSIYGALVERLEALRRLALRRRGRSRGAARRGRGRGAGRQEGARVRAGVGRIVSLEREAPSMLVNLVYT